MARMADLAQRPPTWQTNDATGEQYVDKAEVCGSSWWGFGDAWAQTVHDDGCADCGVTAIAGMSALHDLVNVELGKPLHDPGNFDRMTARYVAAARKAPPGAQAGQDGQVVEAEDHAPRRELLTANDPLGSKAAQQPAVALAAQTALDRIGQAFLGGIGFGIAGHLTRKVLSTIAPGQTAPAAAVDPHLQDQAVKLDVSGFGDLIRERIQDPALFAPDSFRTVIQDDHQMLLACLPENWKNGECEVSQAVVAILHPRNEQMVLIDEARRRDIPVLDDELDQVMAKAASGLSDAPVKSDTGAVLPELQEIGRDLVRVKG